MGSMRRMVGAKAARRGCWPWPTTLGGCGEPRDTLPREPVSGKVKIEGTPLAKGSITFRSTDGSMEAGGLVNDGAFTIPRADGPVPGKYQVAITEALEGPTLEKGEQFSIQPKTKPSRTAPPGTLEAEVKAGGNEEFDFDFQRSAGARPKGRAR